MVLANIIFTLNSDAETAVFGVLANLIFTLYTPHGKLSTNPRGERLDFVESKITSLGVGRDPWKLDIFSGVITWTFSVCSREGGGYTSQHGEHVPF